MRAEVEARLVQLREEHARGQGMLSELDLRRVELERKLLMIAGAIQGLEELLAGEPGASSLPAGELESTEGDS